MDKKIYLHGIYSISDYYDSRMTLKILKKILESDAVLSARLQGKKNHIVLFNGMDYISLCDYEKNGIHILDNSNAFENYVRYSLSLIFPKDKLKVIEPEIVDLVSDYETISKYGLSEVKRYTDLPDEVQVKALLVALLGIIVATTVLFSPSFRIKNDSLKVIPVTAISLLVTLTIQVAFIPLLVVAVIVAVPTLLAVIILFSIHKKRYCRFE